MKKAADIYIDPTYRIGARKRSIELYERSIPETKRRIEYTENKIKTIKAGNIDKVPKKDDIRLIRSLEKQLSYAKENLSSTENRIDELKKEIEEIEAGNI
ncbi:MAG: hypothetical protein V6Z81_05140 [Parvularculales bacterium]